MKFVSAYKSACQKVTGIALKCNCHWNDNPSTFTYGKENRSKEEASNTEFLSLYV